MNDDTKKELAQTAVIGTLGTGTGLLAGKLASKIPAIAKSPTRVGGFAGAAGLLADYGAVKINKAIEKKAETKMSYSKFLTKLANEIYSEMPELQAVELLKQAGFSEEDAAYQVSQHLMEKEATRQLTEAGIDVERAAAMVKAANIDVRSLANFKIEQDPRVAIVEELTKVASYLDSLEHKVEDLEKAASFEESYVPTQPASKETKEAIEKMASSRALTFEDIKELETLSPQVIEKIANAVDQPWEMGRAAGTKAADTDPLLAWLLT